MTVHSVAFVGATGGAGTTRLTVEAGATLSRAGYDVAVLDAAFATQGLAEYVQGRIQPDLTAVLTGDAELDEALLTLPIETPGRLSVGPARAPFHRLASAKTAGAAEAFETQMAAAELSHDVVLVDVPPVGTNPAVAAVTTADARAIVTPDSRRGRDALARMQGRLQDVGAGKAETVLSTFAGEQPVVESATVRLPASPHAPGVCPTTIAAGADLGPSVAAAVEATLGVDLELTFEGSTGLSGLLPGPG